MLVDDDADNLRQLVDILVRHLPTCDIFKTTRPLSAPDIATAERPDVIITDWQMPGISGLELVRRLQADDALAAIPTIMCTGKMLDSEYLSQALAAGAIDFVRKPVDPIELVSRTGAALKLARSRQLVARQIKELAEEKARREQLLLERISLQEKDLEDLTTYLSRQRKELEAVLLKLEAGTPDGSHHLARRLEIELRQKLMARQKVDLLAANLETVNGPFFDKLNGRYGRLSPGERELCAYIRLGMSTKEIAMMRSISPASIKKNKQRLRKKLNLAQQDDLYAVVQSI